MSLVGLALMLAGLGASALTPILCALLFLGTQLLSRRLPPPKAAGAAGDVDFPRAVISLLLWFAIACVAASVYAELGWIAATFAVAACASMPLIDSGPSQLLLFSPDVFDEPLSIAFLYGMLPVLAALPHLLAGPGAFVHTFLWGHLWWAAAKHGSLPNALASYLAVALVVNSFDGFALLERAPLFGTLLALPAGKGLNGLFRLNKAGFFAGVLFAALVSSSVRAVLAALVTTTLTLATAVVASLAAALQQSGVPAARVTMGGAVATGMSGAISGAHVVGTSYGACSNDPFGAGLASDGAVPESGASVSGLAAPAYPR
ncbi:hypothetical protein KFE25_007445 [Diacronema lutheri]|uniref:Uncharacterized protein n=2 Tax=Diacronema lutheri TaxID=2081491 RepID=A0A8J5XUU1_DIALT|nr:hypothetical protein KFE25_007445 [Diacronema lutheri]